MTKIEIIKPLLGLRKYQEWKSQWSDQQGLSIYSYISYSCEPEDVLIASRLFFPELIFIEGCVFLEFKYDPGVVGLLSSYGDQEKMEIERSVNRLALYDAFFGVSSEVSDLIYKQLCDVLVVSWGMVLNKAFPDFEFKVESSFSESEYGPSLTFYKNRKTKGAE